MTDQAQGIAGAQQADVPDDVVRQIVQGYKPAVNAAINQGIDGDAETAAHAMRLQGSTGVPAPLIANTYDEFVPQYKKIAAQGMVNGNPDLQAYVLSHPLAATVSNDDWAALDEWTRKNNGSFFKNLVMRPETQKALEGLIEGAIGGAQGGAQTGIYSSDADVEAAARAMDSTQNRMGLLGALTARIVYTGLDLGAKGFNAFMGAGAGGAVGLLKGAGFDESEANRIVEGEFARGMAESGMHMRPGEAAPKPSEEVGGIAKHDLQGMRQSVHDIMRPFVEAGEDVPAGLHPQIDGTKTQMNASMLEMLEDDLKLATATETRERSPEMFRDALVAGKYGDHAIGINSDAVLALYGDKLPEAEDGLLGWVPDIADQLKAARDTGQDITIPTADWLAQVDPAVAKALRDDTRLWPGGVTAREASEAATEPREVIDDPTVIWRASMGAEPRFQMGDRKLLLERRQPLPTAVANGSADLNIHDWAILDENGLRVGDMKISPSPDGKGLYVNWIGGQAGQWANSFGPALIRDIKRQLKEAYPEREYIAGFRVSGARDKAGKTGPAQARLEQEPEVRVPLVEEVPTEENHFATQEILHAAAGQGENPYGFTDIRSPAGGLDGGPASAAPLPEWYHDVNGAVQELAQNLGVPAPQVFTGTHEGALGGLASNRGHIIVNDRLTSQQALATSIHEFGHHMDFQALEKAEPSVRKAIADAWRRDSGAGKTVEQTRPITAQRYSEGAKQTPANPKYEGSFPEWWAEQVSRWITQTKEPQGVVEKFFAGIADVWRKIYEKVTGHVGLAQEVDDFMRGRWMAETGQEPGPHPISQAIEQMHPVIEGIENVAATSVGMDARTFARLQEATRARAREDLTKAQARAIKQQTKMQSKEWAANRVQMVEETAKQIKQKPDIAADLFLGSGEYNGEKLRQRFTLDESKLTDEQKAGLPAHYVSKSGLNPDEVAPLFGYSTGEEMVAAVSALQKLKVNEAGVPMRTSDWLRKVVQAETDRRMLQKYGDKAANIMDAAKDQALSDSSINVMVEDLMAVAQKMGVTTFDKEVMWQAARDIADSTTIGALNSFRAMQDMGKHSRNAQKAMLAGNWGDAMVHMQRQTLTAMVARELRDVEKEVAKAEKFAKRYAKRDQEGLPPEFTNWIHDIMMRTQWGGRKVLRTPEDLLRQIGAESSQTLEEFVREKSLALDPLHVWEGLLDPSYKQEWKKLKVEEFRNIDDSLRNLAGIGKAERKLWIDGEARDLDAAKQKMLARVQDWDAKTIEEQKGKMFPTQFVKGVYARTLQVENILNMLDGFDGFGPWTTAMFRELKTGDNHGEAWRKEFSGRLNELNDDVDLRRKIPNPMFRASEEYGGHELPMNRGNLRAVMLNWGTKSNRKKLAKGWDVDEAQIEAWINKNADAQDWKFVRGVWKIFEDLKERSDTMERSLGRMATKSVEAVPVKTPFGEFQGGYYPVVYHREYSKVKALGDPDALMQPGYESLEPADGFIKSRTNYTAPVALDMEMLPARLNQVIHRTAMLPGAKNFAKMLYDPEVAGAIKTKLGLEMYKMMDEYIKGVANKANYGMNPWHDALTVSEFLRANVTTALVGFNVLGTAVKHGSTAWMLSFREAGKEYLKNIDAVPSHYVMSAVRQLMVTNEEVGESRYQFAMKHSLELQRRDRNYLESLTGAAAELNVPKSATVFGKDLGAGVEKFMNFRQRLMELASKPLAFSDKLSSVPTWLGVYDHMMDQGMTHGDAVYAADRAVRRAHGSTSITSRPIIMNSLGGWLTTFYNFFNDIFNRQVETVWRAGDAVKLTREGNYDAAMKQAGLVAAGVFAYSIWPALTEEWVSPQKGDEHEGWAKWAAKGLLYTESATMPVVRDLVNGMLHNKNPDVGMTSTIFEHLTAVPRDLQKDHPFSPQHAQVLIKDAAKLGGALVGMPEALAKPLAYAYGVHKNLEHPKGPWGWLVGARYGTGKGHSQTLKERMFGK